MGSHHLNLKWRNHHSNLLSVFSQLLTSEAFADVTLACDGASLRAHKMILSACSPFFHSLFAQHPCQHPIVILKDVPYEDLKVLVDFMYHGEVNITQERLPSFLRTAESLKVKGLSESEAHNRLGPIVHNSPFSTSRPFPDKRAAFGPPKAAVNKKRKKVPAETLGDPRNPYASKMASNHQNLNSTMNNPANSSDYEDSIDPLKFVKASLSEGPAFLDTNMPSLEAPPSGDDRADDSGPPVLPLGNDATSSNNVLEVESYRQLQRMASLLHQGVPQLPLPLSFALPMMKDRGGHPMCLNDDDDNDEDDEDDKFSGELGKLDEEGIPNIEDVHELTRLPRHKKKDCIVCGNRALGIRRRSRQWCPGCNVGVHVHCFDQLVHYRRHSRRSRNDDLMSLSSKIEDISTIADRMEDASPVNARNENAKSLIAKNEDVMSLSSRNEDVMSLSSRNDDPTSLKNELG